MQMAPHRGPGDPGSGSGPTRHGSFPPSTSPRPAGARKPKASARRPPACADDGHTAARPGGRRHGGREGRSCRPLRTFRGRGGITFGTGMVRRPPRPVHRDRRVERGGTVAQRPRGDGRTGAGTLSSPWAVTGRSCAGHAWRRTTASCCWASTLVTSGSSPRCPHTTCSRPWTPSGNPGSLSRSACCSLCASRPLLLPEELGPLLRYGRRPSLPPPQVRPVARPGGALMGELY